MEFSQWRYWVWVFGRNMKKAYVYSSNLDLNVMNVKDVFQYLIFTLGCLCWIWAKDSIVYFPVCLKYYHIHFHSYSTILKVSFSNIVRQVVLVHPFLRLVIVLRFRRSMNWICHTVCVLWGNRQLHNILYTDFSKSKRSFIIFFWVNSF